jgi:hypothetical protein
MLTNGLRPDHTRFTSHAVPQRIFAYKYSFNVFGDCRECASLLRRSRYAHMYAHCSDDAWRHEVCFQITPTHTWNRSTWHCNNSDCKSIRDVCINIKAFIGLQLNLWTCSVEVPNMDGFTRQNCVTVRQNTITDASLFSTKLVHITELYERHFILC